MKAKFERVYQFKIALEGISPPIWRRIQVPETYTFWDLHVAIQDAMGWLDCHLHEFEVSVPSTGTKVKIGIPDEEFGRPILPGWEKKITQYFLKENDKAGYCYDFGDGWSHKVELEKILPREKDVNYPRCIEGKRACPPEDCGGVSGYEELLSVMKDKPHERYEEMVEWLGGEFDPERFDPKEVKFDDPAKRLRTAFDL